MRNRLFLVFLGLGLHQLAFGEDANKDIRRSFWSIGADGFSHKLRNPDGNLLKGGGMAVQLGHGFLYDRGFISGSVDVIAGPHNARQAKEGTRVDFGGTGLTLGGGYGIGTEGLRERSGSYGISLALNYFDVVGRSVGSRRSIDETSNVVTEDYVMRVTSFSLLPGIFYTWLKPPRPAGNDPELLTTRIEGVLINIGLTTPLLTSYNVRYIERLSDKAPVSIKKKGQLTGYTFHLAINVLLGV